MSADLDALLTCLYVLVDDLLPARRRRGTPPRISDSELICLAIAQVLLDCPNERRFLRLARQRLSHLFPYVPGQSGFNGELVVSDKGFAGAEFEAHVRSLGAELIRPDRKDENPRFGSLGGIRQWIESTFNTLKEQLSLERHGGRTLTGLVSRIARRLLALTAVILHNWQDRQPRPPTNRLRPLRNQSSSGDRRSAGSGGRRGLYPCLAVEADRSAR